MSPQYYFILQNVEVLSSFAPVIFLLLTKSKTRLSLRWVSYFLACSWLIAECINWYLSRNGFNTFLVFHIYDSVSTIGYLLFFHIAIPKYVSKAMIYSLSAIYLLSVWLTVILTDGYFESVTVSNILTFFIPFCLSLLTFYSIATEAKISSLLHEPIYWMNSAILIHFGLGVANIALEIIVGKGDLILYIWPFVLVANILHNLIFSIGIWKMNRT